MTNCYNTDLVEPEGTTAVGRALERMLSRSRPACYHSCLVLSGLVEASQGLKDDKRLDSPLFSNLR